MEMGIPRRIKNYGLNPLFIYSVRHPFDRIESEYNFAYLNQKGWAGFEITDFNVVAKSMYFLQIREFIKWFPDVSRYFIVDFDDLISKPSRLASRIFKWAGLSRFTIQSPRPQNKTLPRSAVERKLMGFSQFWRGFASDTLRKKVKRFLREHDAPAKRTLGEKGKSKLRPWLQRDMNQFQERFGFPVSKWGF
jgi:hypothetical protein